MENDVFGALDATATTTTPGQHGHEASSQTGQIIHELEVESERNRLGNAGVLKATSGNAPKRLKSRVITRAGKSAEAVIKQFATQELQVAIGKDAGMEREFHERSGA